MQNRSDAALPLSLTAMIKGTMLMMAILLALYGYRACYQGEFECSLNTFPDISHVIGVAPLNKLYAMMLLVYSFTKQAEALAYHDRLTRLGVSATTTSLLLVFANVSILLGPCIGFFNLNYNVQWHCKVTQIFTIGEIGYCFLITYLLSSNRSQLTPTS